MKNTENQVVSKKQSLNTNWEEKQFVINSKSYYYNGPLNKETEALLQMLSQMEIDSKSKTDSILSKIYVKYETIEQKYFCKRTFLNGNLTFDLNELIKIIVYWSAYFSVLAESINIKNDQEVKNYDTKQKIAQYLPLFAFLYTFFSQIFQQIKDKTVWVIIVLLFVIIPSLVLVGYHLNLFYNSYKFSGDYVGLGLCITSIVMFINSILNKALFVFISDLTNKLIGTLFNCGFCILASYFILFKIIAFTLLLGTSQQIVNSLSDTIAPSVFIIIFFISFFLIKRLFLLQPKQIQKELEAIQQLYQPDLTEEYPMYKYTEKFANMLAKLKPHLISKIAVTLFYVGLELYFYANLIIQLQVSSPDFSQIICYAFLLVAMPIYISLGIIISNYRNEPSKIYLYIPLFLGALLSLITIKIWESTISNEYIKNIARLIGVSPLIVTLLWLTVAFFRYSNLTQKSFSITISCVCFAFPIGILLTLSQNLNNDNIRIGVIILFVMGCIPIVVIIFYYIFICLVYLFKLPAQAERLNFQIFKYINLSYYGLWLNSIFYIITFYSISYFVINEPSTATGTKKGTMIGLLIIHTMLFLQTNASLSLKVSENYEPNYKIVEKQIKKYENFSLFGIVVPLLVMLPISLALYSQNAISETTEIAILSTSVGVPFSFCYFLFQIKTKLDSSSYQNFLLPLLTILVWIFFIGPIGVLFPILADIYENSSSQFAVFAQLAVAYTLLICILYVTSSSIFYSVLLNKEYQEMKKREVLKVVMALFAENKVSCYEDVCALIFVRYIQQNDPITLKINLIQGDPVNVVDYPGEDKGKQFDFLLVIKSDYEARMRLKQIQEQKKKLQSMVSSEYKETSQTTNNQSFQKSVGLDESLLSTLSEFIYQCLFCNYGSNELDKLEKHLEKERKRLQQIQRSSKTHEQDREISTFKHNQVQLGKDFFTALKDHKPDRPERFWLAVYQVFKNNFSTILDYLELEQDDELLQKQYKSYRTIGEDNFTISIEDFALLLYDNYSRQDLTNYSTLLWEQALKNFMKFNLNHYKQLSDHFTKLNTNTVFHSFKPPRQSAGQRQKLRPLQKMKQQQNSQQNQQDSTIENENTNQLKLYKNFPSKFKLQIWKCCRFFHEFLWVKPILLTQKFMGQIASSFFPKIQQQSVQTNPKNEKWEVIAAKASDTLVSECSKFDIKMLEKENIFKITFTNVSALVLKIYDIYGLATLAFDSQVGWFGQNQTFNPINTVDYSAIWSEYTFFFILALVMSVGYFFLGIKASQQITKNTYGFDENLQVATWRNFNFWISKSIQFISGQFIFVMKTYIDAFICDYSSYPYTLVRESKVECMSDVHFIYVVFAVLGCGIYFPLSTYLQPTFQYMDHSLDLKYKSSYVVIYSQAKLLILGLSSVFSNFKAQAYTYQMLFSSLVMLLLILFHYKLKPCYVKWFNILELGMLGLLFLLYFGAFLIMATSEQIAGYLFVGILGVPIIFITSNFLYKRIQDKQQNSNKIHPQDSQDCFQTSMLLGAK